MLEPTALRAPGRTTVRKGTSKRGKRKRDRKEDRDKGDTKLTGQYGRYKDRNGVLY
jgi:hypothetical protein